MVKPWNSVRIILGLGLSDPDIRPGLDNRHLIIEGHGWSFPITRLTFQVRKVMGGGWVGWWPVGMQDYSVSPSPGPFPLDFGFGTWIWDLDLGLGFRNWIWDWTCA